MANSNVIDLTSQQIRVQSKALPDFIVSRKFNQLRENHEKIFSLTHILPPLQMPIGAIRPLDHAMYVGYLI